MQNMSLIDNYEDFQKELELFFDKDELPSPINYPQSFSWYLKLYKYYLSQAELENARK